MTGSYVGKSFLRNVELEKGQEANWMCAQTATKLDKARPTSSLARAYYSWGGVRAAGKGRGLGSDVAGFTSQLRGNCLLLCFPPGKWKRES